MDEDLEYILALILTNKWKKHIVIDSDDPAYFSHRAIWGFSLFFTVIFGAVLLASILKENNKARFIVIGFGILYTALSVVILAQISRNTSLTIPFLLAVIYGPKI